MWRHNAPFESNLLTPVASIYQFTQIWCKLYTPHAQRKFVKFVLYQKIIGLATLTIVESFMLVSGIAQSWLLAAQLIRKTLKWTETEWNRLIAVLTNGQFYLFHLLQNRMKQTRNLGQCPLRIRVKRNVTMKQILFLVFQFFYKTHFCFVTNETNKIYRENSETGWNRPTTLVIARYETGQNKMKRWNRYFFS